MAESYRADREFAVLVRAALGAWLLVGGAATVATAQAAGQATRTVEKHELEIAVVSRGGEAAPGTRVIVGRHETGAAAPEGAAPRLSRDDLAAVERSAAVATADATGKASVPRPDGPLVVVARRGRERAIALVPAGPAGAGASLRLELAPAPGLDVRVVDPRRAPVAGVEVRLLRGVPSWPRAVATATSDGDGRVSFDDLDLLDARALRTDRFGIGTSIPSVDSPPTEVDVRSPPADPVEIVVPATGRLVVELHGEDGDLVDEAGDLDVSPAYAAARRVTLGAAEPVRVSARRSFEGGRVVLPHVAAGLGLDLHARLKSGREIQGRSAGPSQAGEEVTVVLSVPAPGPFLAGRLLDESGAPLRNVALAASVISAIGDRVYSRDLSGITDEEGLFRLDATGATLAWDEVLRRDQERSHAQIQFTVAGPDREVERRVKVACPEPVAGVADLRDVRMPRFAELARGFVVDDAGSPVAGIEVGLQRLDDHAKLGGDAIGRALLAEGTSDARGAFVLRGEDPGEGFGVRAVTGEALAHLLAPPPIPLHPSAGDLRLVLTRVGSIEARILLAEGTSAKALDVKIARSDGTTIALRWPEIAFDGGVWFDGLAPGSYDLEFTRAFARDVAPLIRLERVVVPAGGPSIDPRLDAVDLRGRFHSIEVEARTADGQRVRKAQALSLPVAGGPQQLLGWIVDGRGVLGGEGDLFDFELRAEKLRFETIRGARDRATVVMRPALVLRVRVDPAPADFTITRLDAFRAADKASKTSSIFSMQTAEIVGPRELLLALPGPGAYDLSLYAQTSTGGRPVSKRIELPPDVSRIEVAEPPDGAEEHVTIRVETPSVSHR
jgi:hypothetical protein